MHLVSFSKLCLYGSVASLTMAERLWPFMQKASAGAIRFLPAIDMDGSACFFTSAIDRNTFEINSGVEVSRDPNAPSNPWECRGIDRALSNNVYVRERCTGDGWCAYLYGYYFEKDEGGVNDWGHKHDWEHIIVWALNGQVKWLGWSAHGDFSVNKAENVEWEGDHAKFIVHRGGGLTHSFRRAEGGELPENPARQWLFGTAIDVQQMPEAAARNLTTGDFGSAHILLHEGGFNKAYDSTWAQIKNWKDNVTPRPDPGPPPTIRELNREL